MAFREKVGKGEQPFSAKRRSPHIQGEIIFADDHHVHKIEVDVVGCDGRDERVRLHHSLVVARV